MTDTDVIVERLKNFQSEMKTAMSGVHARLDTMNGNVVENTSWRDAHEDAHEADDAFAAGRKSLLGDLAVGWKAMIALVGAAQIAGGGAVLAYFLERLT